MKRAAAILVFLLVALIAQPSQAELRVVVMNVGQGQALLLGRGDHGILIDAGMASSADALLRRIEAHGVTTLDYFIVTHLHPDHVGGYFHVRERFPEAVLADNDHPLSAPRQDLIVNLYGDALVNDPNRQPLRAGDEVLWRDVAIKVLWPSAFADQNLNRHSLVLSITYGESRALVMADAGEYVERQLVEQGAVRGPLSLLVAGHHGMRGSAGPRFLALVKPRVAVISANWKVPAYLPDNAVAARIKAASGRFLRTDEDGEICLDLAADNPEPTDC